MFILQTKPAVGGFAQSSPQPIQKLKQYKQIRPVDYLLTSDLRLQYSPQQTQLKDTLYTAYIVTYGGH
jgi:hypothetical protein